MNEACRIKLAVLAHTLGCSKSSCYPVPEGTVSGAGLLGATLPDVARALTIVSKACGLKISNAKEPMERTHTFNKQIKFRKRCIFITFSKIIKMFHTAFVTFSFKGLAFCQG